MKCIRCNEPQEGINHLMNQPVCKEHSNWTDENIQAIQKIMNETNETSDKTEIKQKPAHLFKPGESGNPNGRPKGTYSLKTKIIKMLEENPDKEALIIADLFEKEQGLILQMIDGKPKQSMDLAVKELPIIEISETIINKHDTSHESKSDSQIN